MIPDVPARTIDHGDDRGATGRYIRLYGSRGYYLRYRPLLYL